MKPPRFTPLHPDFPIEQYLAAITSERDVIDSRDHARAVTAVPPGDPIPEIRMRATGDGPAPYSFTSFAGPDFPQAPSLTWSALQKIWDRTPVECCDACKGKLYVYGFAVQMTRGVVARACLTCKLSYLETVTRGLVVAQVRVWGFDNFKVGYGAGLTAKPTEHEALVDALRQLECGDRGRE